MDTFCHTESDEKYWLFYYLGRATELETLQPDGQFWGNWLDKYLHEDEYRLVSKKTLIVALNLICFLDEELGSMRQLKQGFA